MNVSMKKERIENSYLPPKLVIVEISELLEDLGPAIACSGFSGAVSNC